MGNCKCQWEILDSMFIRGYILLIFSIIPFIFIAFTATNPRSFNNSVNEQVYNSNLSINFHIPYSNKSDKMICYGFQNLCGNWLTGIGII